MLLDDMYDYLVSAGITAAIGKGEFFETPDTFVALRETGGQASQHALKTSPGKRLIEVLTLQVLARDPSYEAAAILIRSLLNTLDGLRDVTVNGVVYYLCTAMQQPFLLMRDENQRFILAFNLMIRRQTVP